jgi:hypothetical protein
LPPLAPDNSPLATRYGKTASASSSFEIVDIPPDRIKEIASGPTISNCNGCQRKFAQMVGANWAAWGTVQKVSNLILNINVYIEDAESGKMKFARSVDIRGNTDESWRRGSIICCAIICCASPNRRHVRFPTSRNSRVRHSHSTNPGGLLIRGSQSRAAWGA